MKRIVISLILFAFVSCSFIIPFTAAQYINSASAPVIDGNIDDLWYEQPLNSIALPVSGSADISADYRMVWNNNIIYLLVRVFDTDIVSTGNYEERDGITLWLNPSDKRDGNVYKIMITAPADSGIKIEGEHEDLSLFNRTSKKAYVKTDYGYMIEASFDLSSLFSDFAASDGTSIGFDIWVSDQTDGAQNILSWYGYDGGAMSVLKDTVSFMTVSVPDDDPSSDGNDSIPGTDDVDGTYFAFAFISLCGMLIVMLYKKEKEYL